MTRQESFECLWSLRHDVPVESLVQYRFESRDGYRLPDMAAHYRTHCEALDSVAIDWSDLSNCFSPDGCGDWAIWLEDMKKIAEAAGLKVAQ